MINKARAFLDRYRSFLVTGHLAPDGDAIGSQLALFFHLRDRGRAVFLVADEPLPEIFRFLPGSEHFQSLDGFRARPETAPPPEAAIFVECCARARAGATGALAGRLPCLNIDHHPDNSRYGQVNLVDARAAACGQVIYRLLAGHSGGGGRPVLRPETATALYTAILTDTSSFRFNVSAGLLRTVAALVSAGACPDRIAAAVYERLGFETMRLLGEVLATLSRTSDGRLVWCRIERSMYRRTGTSDRDSEGFIDYLRVIGGAVVTFVVKALPDGRTRVNLRSKGDWDVQGVAAGFGGGGHRNAAGCTIDAALPRAEALVLEAVGRMLGMAAAGQSGGRS